MEKSISKKRCVTKHGPSSLSVTLPSSWTKQQKIKKGDLLSAEPDGDFLVISKNSKQDSTLKEFYKKFPELQGYMFHDKEVLARIEKTCLSRNEVQERISIVLSNMGPDLSLEQANLLLAFTKQLREEMNQ